MGLDGGGPGRQAVTNGASDFERLERAVAALAERAAEYRIENEELRRALQEATLQRSQAEQTLREERGLRAAAVHTIDGLLGRLDRLAQHLVPADAAEESR